MSEPAGKKFDIHTYESPRNASSYVDPFAGGTASYFALNDKIGPVQTCISQAAITDSSNNLKQAFDPAPQSLQAPEQPKTLLDPCRRHPELNLSGRLISASVCIPHTLRFDRSRAWDLSQRKGTSALFDHFTYLSSKESPWDHTLVAWTGEIDSTGNVSKAATLPRRSDTAKATPSIINPSKGVYSPGGNARPSSGVKRGVVIDREDRTALENLLWHDPEVRTLPVWLYDEAEENRDSVMLSDQSRWRRYAEHELYTDFHYRLNPPTDGNKERKWWADYVRMNQKFADRIMSIYQPGDIVWIHDYQLMLLPAILRQRNAKMYIGFFLHSPFPSSELFRCLKNRKELLLGALGANLVGFQTFSYARHFSSCCTRILDFNALPSGVDAYGAHIAVDYHPIGIDSEAIEHQIFYDPLVDAAIERIRAQYDGMKIIVGRDRLDTGRGVIQKLQAYELFLERYPDWQGRVVLIQLTNTTSIEEGKEDTESAVIKKVSNQIADINDIYGDSEWTPVLHFPQHLSEVEYLALLRAADLGLVTSVRDGMNTTALEFVIAQRDNHSPLILSEFSGTAAKLQNAILVNPWDLASVASEINGALLMSSDQKRVEHNKLYERVKTETVSSWSSVYLNTLMVHLASFNKNLLTHPLSKADVLLQYRKSRRRLFMFDYDGTLTPAVKEADAAIPSDRVIRTIKKLAQDPRNNVWIISGRKQDFLNEWMAHIPELGLSAEHGSFIREPESEEWTNLAEKFDMSWQVDALRIMEDYAERTQGSNVEKKENSITWHFRRADPDLGNYQAQECLQDLKEALANRDDVEILAGKAHIEARPRFVNKGEIAKRLLNSYRRGSSQGESAVLHAGPDFVMCLGDDLTDEDMFKTMNESELPKETIFTCVVGASTKRTQAKWHLLEPSDVISTLSMLNGRPIASDEATVEEVEGKLREEAIT